MKLEGKSKQIEIPITKQHVPNFALAAAVVRDYEVFSAQQEIFVPPAKQMLKVQVKSDKAAYKPGETGTFEIKATDWQGKPWTPEIAKSFAEGGAKKSDSTHLERLAKPGLGRYLLTAASPSGASACFCQTGFRSDLRPARQSGCIRHRQWLDPKAEGLRHFGAG